MSIASGKTWREEAAAVIARVVAENPGVTGSDLRQILNRALPFGRSMRYSHKIWCEEVAKACGTYNPPLGKRERAQVERYAAIMATQKSSGASD